MPRQRRCAAAITLCCAMILQLELRCHRRYDAYHSWLVAVAERPMPFQRRRYYFDAAYGRHAAAASIDADAAALLPLHIAADGAIYRRC